MKEERYQSPCTRMRIPLRFVPDRDTMGTSMLLCFPLEQFMGLIEKFVMQCRKPSGRFGKFVGRSMNLGHTKKIYDNLIKQSVVEILHGTVSSLPFSDNMFDFVTAFETDPHFDLEEQFEISVDEDQLLELYDMKIEEV